MSIRGHVKQQADETLSNYKAGAEYVEREAEARVDPYFSDTRMGRAMQTGTMITAVTLGLTIIIGILIYDQVQNALPTPTNTDLSNASDNTTSDFANAMELAPVVILVMIAALVLAVVQRFQ